MTTPAIPRLSCLVLAIGLLNGSLAAAPWQGGRGGRGIQRPEREAARPQPPAGTATLAGRVVAADTGRPIKRAHVVASGAGRPFSATTDDQGRYRLIALPAARYTITATRTGFVTAVFGQRRPLAPGTPVAVADGEEVGNVDLRLVRGGVIAGRIVDEDGEPLAQALVTVHRHQYVAGEKQMTPAGGDQSDDRGQFRVFGLAPGDYFVSAIVGGIERLIASLPQSFAPQADAAASTGYAATYYPGVIAPAEASPVRVGPAQEVGGIECQLRLVPLATVRGTVSGGAQATVRLIPEGSSGGAGGGGRGGGGRGGARGGGALAGAGSGALVGLGAALAGAMQLRAATGSDGSFTIPNVTPGNYTIVARTGGGREGATAIQPLAVLGEEVFVSLSPAPGIDVTGTVTVESATGQVPGTFGRFRVAATPLGAAAAVPRGAPPAPADEKGAFALRDLIPGEYLITATAPAGWTMKAVYVDGRDATDRAITIKSSAVSGVNVIFTDRITSLAGSVRADAGAAPAGITVIAFAADDAQWYPQSRFIRTARTGEAGAYRLTALPPGDYLVAAIDDVEAGEWLDPAFLDRIRAGAVKVRLDEGEQRTQDLRVSASSPASPLF